MLLASATGWTLALSDANNYQEASRKVSDFVTGVEKTLDKYTTKEERKFLEYTPVGVAAGKVVKQGLSHVIEGGLLKKLEGVFFTKSDIKLVKDARLDGYTSEAAYDFLKNTHFKEIKIIMGQLGNTCISTIYILKA